MAAAGSGRCQRLRIGWAYAKSLFTERKNGEKGGPKIKDALVPEKHANVGDKKNREGSDDSENSDPDDMTGKSRYRATRKGVRDRLPLKDHMGRLVSRPAYYGMKLRRTRMPPRVRGHVDLPIVAPLTVDAVLAAGFAAQEKKDKAAAEAKEQEDAESEDGSGWLAKRKARQRELALKDKPEEVHLRNLPVPKVISKAAEPDPAVGMVTDACLVRGGGGGGGGVLSPSNVLLLGSPHTRRQHVHSAASLTMPGMQESIASLASLVDPSAGGDSGVQPFDSLPSAQDTVGLHSLPPNALVVGSRELRPVDAGPGAGTSAGARARAPVVINAMAQPTPGMVPAAARRAALNPDEDLPMRVPIRMGKLPPKMGGGDATAAWHEQQDHSNVDFSERLLKAYEVVQRKEARVHSKSMAWKKVKKTRKRRTAPMPVLASADRLFTAAYVSNQQNPTQLVRREDAAVLDPYGGGPMLDATGEVAVDVDAFNDSIANTFYDEVGSEEDSDAYSEPSEAPSVGWAMKSAERTSRYRIPRAMGVVDELLAQDNAKKANLVARRQKEKDAKEAQRERRRLAKQAAKAAQG